MLFAAIDSTEWAIIAGIVSPLVLLLFGIFERLGTISAKLDGLPAIEARIEKHDEQIAALTEKGWRHSATLAQIKGQWKP